MHLPSLHLKSLGPQTVGPEGGDADPDTGCGRTLTGGLSTERVAVIHQRVSLPSNQSLSFYSRKLVKLSLFLFRGRKCALHTRPLRREQTKTSRSCQETVRPCSGSCRGALSGSANGTNASNKRRPDDQNIQGRWGIETVLLKNNV